MDVVEFSYYTVFTSNAATSREQAYTELVEGLRGSDPQIGPGSQVSMLLLDNTYLTRSLQFLPLSYRIIQ